MGAPVQFDPWAVLQELRQGPAATAATAARPAETGTPAALAAIAANRPNAASAAVAAAGGSKFERTRLRLCRRNGRTRSAASRPGRRPESIPAERWAQAVVDTGYLVREWGTALIRCGWTLIDSFARTRERPLVRYDTMGLCLLAAGPQARADRFDRIAIRHPGGAVLRFRRESLPAAETGLLWELT